MLGFKNTVIYVLACISVSLLAWAIGSQVLTWLLGSAYSEMSVLLPSLVIYAGAVLWFENEKVLAMARLRHHRVVIARVAQVCLLLILIFPAVKFFSVAGAGIATATSAVVLALVATRSARTTM